VAKFQKQQYLKYQEKIYRQFWFPDYWLAFVLLSLPAEDRCIPCFQSRSASDIQQEFVKATSVDRATMGRSQRRLEDRQAVQVAMQQAASRSASPTVVQSPIGSISGNKRSFTHNIVVTEGKSEADDDMRKRTKLEMITRQLENLKQFEQYYTGNRDEEKLKKIREEIGNLLEESLNVHSGF
jgi:hypothetical protein